MVSVRTRIFHNAYRWRKRKCSPFNVTAGCEQDNCQPKKRGAVSLTSHDWHAGKRKQAEVVGRSRGSWFIVCVCVCVCVCVWDELNAFQMGNHCPTLAHLNHLPHTQRGSETGVEHDRGKLIPSSTPTHRYVLPSPIFKPPSSPLSSSSSPFLHPPDPSCQTTSDTSSFFFFLLLPLLLMQTVCRSSRRTPVGTLFFLPE